jgi:hypothetical protein
MKHCPACGNERNLDNDEFPTRANPHGTGVQYRCQCRECEAARGRDYRAQMAMTAPTVAPLEWQPSMARVIRRQLGAGRPIERVAKAVGVTVVECRAMCREFDIVHD